VRFPIHASPGRQLAMERGRSWSSGSGAAQAPSPETLRTQLHPPLAQGLEAEPGGLWPQFLTHRSPAPARWPLPLPESKAGQRLAEARLSSQPNDDEALWSLALLAGLQNRPTSRPTAGSAASRAPPHQTPGRRSLKPRGRCCLAAELPGRIPAVGPRRPARQPRSRPARA